MSLSFTIEIFKRTPSATDAPGVLYLSYGAARSRQGGLHPVWWWSHAGIAASEGANDGLVSLRSAHWGHYIKSLHADHLEVVGLQHDIPGYTRLGMWSTSTADSQPKVARSAPRASTTTEPETKSERSEVPGFAEGRLEHGEVEAEAGAEKEAETDAATPFDHLHLYQEIMCILADRGL